jgi:hypothetical protein
MKKLALCSLAVVTVAGLATLASADQQQKWDKDHSAPPVQTRGLLDCTDAIDAGCGFTYTGTNSFGVNNVQSYNCHGFTESGPELVFTLPLSGTTNVTIDMVTDGGDLDLQLLAACDENQCIAYSAGIDVEQISVDCLPAGTYYIVVDGYNGTEANFDLSITCSTCVEPSGNETCDTADPLACGDVSLATNTSGAANNYDPGSGNSCTGYSASGGDLVWSFCVPNGGGFNFTFAELDYDSSVYVVTDCANLVGTCLDGDDCYPYPCNDILTYTNSSGGDINAYLIVDGFAGETGNGQLSGTLDCCGPNPTETTTWGSVKARFGN